MIDDMAGLYSHTSDAYRAGKERGRDDFFRAVQTAIVRISTDYESEAVSGPGEPLATRGFHASQKCAKAVADLKERFDTERKTV